jgi:hypothetical protein
MFSDSLFAICSFAICHLLICHLPFAHLPFAICHLPFAHLPRYAIITAMTKIYEFPLQVAKLPSKVSD